jgi:hypothetical protein
MEPTRVGKKFYHPRLVKQIKEDRRHPAQGLADRETPHTHPAATFRNATAARQSSVNLASFMAALLTQGDNMFTVLGRKKSTYHDQGCDNSGSFEISVFLHTH